MTEEEGDSIYRKLTSEAPPTSGTPTPHFSEEETEAPISLATGVSLPSLQGLLWAEPAPRSPTVLPSPRSQGGGRHRVWEGHWHLGSESLGPSRGGVLALQGALPVNSNEVLGEKVMKPPPGLREAVLD